MDHPAPSRTGGRRAFAQLYRDEFAFAWRTLLRLGVPAPDCDDAVHDVFLTAHRRWSTQREPDRQRAWLAGIVRRIAWRHRRARDRRERKLDAIAKHDAPVRGLDDELARREAWQLLAGFLDELDEPKRAAFVLGELESLGRIELGAALGVNPNTAYSRLLAARGSFVRRFGAIDDDDGRAQLLARAGEHDEPPATAQTRCWASLAGLVGAKATSAAMLGWGAIAAVVVAGLATAVVPASSAPPPPAAIARAEPAPAAAAIASAAPDATGMVPVAIPPSPTPAPLAAVVAPRSDRTARARPSALPTEVPPPAAAPAPAPQQLGPEVTLLLDARRAIVTGDEATARRHLAEHRARFGDDAALDEVRGEIERELSRDPSTPPRAGD